ncbi:MAG TPA: hypothetical protein VMC02_14390 [Steroidobacteraceae bacterium]|nr:hypothetical protein [Steroidobacteraceae bacterium]
MRKNYQQVRKQRELAKKIRQQEKLHRRTTRPVAATGATHSASPAGAAAVAGDLDAGEAT